ncbi:MAG: AAA family ATPase [Actinobacteria bacterium]|nr:AAA family ATPase [Actinomycetota bacterium]
MRIKKISIARYGPLSGINLDIGKGLQVIYGKNEAGKTLTVDAIVKIMLKGKTRDFEYIDRVAEDPEGFIVMEDPEGEEIKLTVRNGLSGYLGLGSLDLRNIFIIRDSDLTIKDEGGYYKNFADKLTGLQLERLDNVMELLRKYGRLVRAKSDAGLSDTRESGKILSLKSRALAFISEVDDYLKVAGEMRADDLEIDLLNIRGEIDGIKAMIKLQEKASRVNAYKSVSRELDSIEKKWSQYAGLSGFDQEHYDILNSGYIELSSIKKEIGSLQAKLKNLEMDRDESKKKISDVDRKLWPYQSKLKDIENAKHDLELYSERKNEETSGTGRQIKMLLYLFAILCVLGFPAVYVPTHDMLFALILSGASFIAVVVLSAIVLKNSARQSVFYRRASSLEERFRKIGFRIEGINDIYTELKEFNDNYEVLLHERDIVENELKGTVIRIEGINERMKELEQRQSFIEKSAAGVLSGLAVHNMGEFEDNFRKRAKLETDIKASIKNLLQESGFLRQAGTGQGSGSEDVEDIFGSLEMNISGWRKILENEAPAEEDIEKELPGFDRKKYGHLKIKLEELESERDQLTARLENHRKILGNFEASFLDMELRNFQEYHELSGIGSLDHLKRASEAAGRFVEKVDLRHRTACEAIRIFEEIKGEKETKISDMFRELEVSGIFGEITSGKYSEVRFNPEDQGVGVVDGNGRVMDASKLSKGAYDQLFLAIRVALSREILGGKAGFFIMDDPFLSSDLERLEKQFEILDKMVGSGWSILYFSVKNEVKELASRYSKNNILELQEKDNG